MSFGSEIKEYRWVIMLTMLCVGLYWLRAHLTQTLEWRQQLYMDCLDAGHPEDQCAEILK